MSKKCLNCGREIDNNFCSTCGQKTSIHRFSSSHLVAHDFIHGVFHLDKGILFTIKELFTRPGHSIREYIQGKRVNHYNYFMLLFIIIALVHLMSSYYLVDSSVIYGGDRKADFKGFDELYDKYGKGIILLTIPLMAIVTWIGFKKSKQNYIECVVSLIYMYCGLMILYLVNSLIALFYDNVIGLQIIYNSVSVMQSIYIIFFLHQYYSIFYLNKKLLIIRSVIVTFLILLTQVFSNSIIQYIGKVYYQ